MPESFGARLRQQREKRGIAIQALAKQTRIKEALLEALERDDLSQWPSGFYRRAFFRAYASAIGLNADETFCEFQRLYPEPPEADVLTAMAAALGRGEPSSRTIGLRSAVESAFSSLARFRSSAPGDPESAAQSVPQPQLPALPPLPPTPESPVEPQQLSTESQPSTYAAPANEAPRRVEPKPAPEPDLQELATLCVELGCVNTAEGVESLLEHAARMIGATGLILWALNPRELQLQAALVHGYPPKVVEQLPMVRRGDNNATAEAFRTTETRVFKDSPSGKCAVAIPLRTASGCVGVFAVELNRGIEATKSRVAVATVVAAQLAPIADCLARPVPFQLPLAVNADVQTV
jgi:transcriptional regulator with XRE-family HTH domain